MPLLNVEMLLDTVQLPPGYKWFEFSGQREWPIYLRDGRFSSISGSWIVTQRDEKWFGCGVFFNVSEREKISTEVIQGKVDKAITEMQEFEDGGPMPMPENLK